MPHKLLKSFTPHEHVKPKQTNLKIDYPGDSYIPLKILFWGILLVVL